MQDSSINLLLVTDDALFKKIEAEMVSSGLDNLSLRQAGSLAEAVGLMRHENFDLVFTELDLPDVEGPDVARKIKEHHPQSRVVVIVGPGEWDLASQAMRSGANSTLTADRIGGGELAHKVHEVYFSKRAADVAQACEAEADHLVAFPRESPYPILECDAAGFPVYVNPAASRTLETLGVDLLDLLPNNHPEIVATCLNTQQSAIDIEVPVRDRVFSWVYQPVPAFGTIHLHGIDITLRRRAEESLQKNALRDPLTGLPNRALLMDRLTRNIEMAGRHDDYQYAVILLDLDRFKIITENLGHPYSDELLLEVTRRLKSCVKQSDTIARTTGDEFVILLEDIGSPGNATRIADRIRREIAEPFRLGDKDIVTSASMGINVASSGAPPPADPDEMLRNAWTAMFRSKNIGKGQYAVFDEAMHRQATRQLQLEADLRSALQREELEVYYQPILMTSSKKIEGFEALARWTHAEHGNVSPAEFISIAEETGLDNKLDEWVMQVACRQLKKWQERGFADLTGSINLSGSRFQQPDLLERVDVVLRETGLDPRTLKLEVTENVAVRDARRAVEILEALREKGVTVMIDDFGTGYSSLSYLKSFPVDVLKIDRSFIFDMHNDQQSGAIVTTIIMLAHALGFDVVAEGVEEEAQFEILKRHNCDFVQGFLFGRPVPAHEFSELLKEA